MEIKQMIDKAVIQKFLLQDPYLHIYEMGDLQEKLFKHITWHAALEKGEIRAISMLYAHEEPIFFLLENTDTDAAKELLSAQLRELPPKMYCHISKGLAGILEKKYRFTQHDDFIKMKLAGDILVDGCIKYPEYTFRVNKNDSEQIAAFLKSVNPAAFFVHGMLETGKYFCIRKNNELLSMAGVHLYTKEYGVAAIGNVVTLESERGRGYARSVTASLCRDLWPDVRYIGLNVRANNAPAIKAYEKIGFVKNAENEELRAEKK
jgi:ribosomal protein S18 acetylase RimI-like enzyme